MRRGRKLAQTLLAVIGLAACGGSSESKPTVSTISKALPAAELSLVAYSTPQEAYDKITDSFTKGGTGPRVSFTKSYGSSGEQSRAVSSGLAADYVAFSVEPDMTRLVKDDIVAADWNSGPHKGMVTGSVVVFVVRKGNPQNVKTWEDLAKPDIEVINPNPFASGGARWNVMAAYGQKIKSGGSEQDAVAYLSSLFKNISVQDDSARKSLQTFAAGKGDVLLAYENEAIFAQQKGQKIDYVVPESTILIENPAAVTKTSKAPEHAKAFLEYVYTPEAQKIFAQSGYRPMVAGVAGPYEFVSPPGLFTIADLGGWTEVTKKFFDPENSIVARIQRGKGISVG